LELFALEGEDSSTPATGDDGPAAEPLTFSWRLQGLQLDLGTLLDHLHDRPVWAGVASRDETLASPCLLCGDNGQGKSLIAKALASAMPYTGKATVYGPNGSRRVRLLFQDVLNQTLMRSMRQLAAQGNAKDVAVAYDDILDGVRRRVPEAGDPLIAFGDRRRSNTRLSLLEMKVLLAAVRLSDQRAVLILDEPDWGLSRSDAVAFVTAVVSAAHARSVPVMLISHKPWWRNLARSVRWVRKEAVPASAAKGCLFRVQIHDAPEGVA
jgi:ABC-type Mn2+/Zn2+ transport system ATPase subunit